MDHNLVSVTLKEASTAQVEVLLSWFNNQHDITYWGGPGLTFPVGLKPFIRQIKFHELPSFSLVDRQGNFLAFGQFYRRLNRNHLGRLAVNPNHRGKGLGKKLVVELIVKACHLQGQAQTSLFVMRDNVPAISLYQSLGFVEQNYPEPLTGVLANCAYMVLA